MTIIDYILPMPKRHRVIFLTYTDATLLDLIGASTVFRTASWFASRYKYEPIAVSSSGGLITHNCGMVLNTRPVTSLRFVETDTVLVIGGFDSGIEAAIEDGKLINSMQSASRTARRYGSICSGTLLVGEAGLLEGKQATTHWDSVERMHRCFAVNNSESDELYIKDDRLWTSAGVTTGIDMALAMVEEDHGSVVKARVAKQLVVYSHRPGHQSQFSQVLDSQTRIEQHFSGLNSWLLARLDSRPKVEDMAEFVGMSARSFHRKFNAQFGSSPGKYLERLRLDHARELIEAGELIKVVVDKVGFRSDAAFRTAFKEAFGVTPSQYALMNSIAESLPR